MLELAFLGLFCVIVYLCMCAFVVLELVSSVLCQEIGWKEVSEMTYFVSILGRKTLTQSMKCRCLAPVFQRSGPFGH